MGVSGSKEDFEIFLAPDRAELDSLAVYQPSSDRQALRPGCRCWARPSYGARPRCWRRPGSRRRCCGSGCCRCSGGCCSSCGSSCWSGSRSGCRCRRRSRRACLNVSPRTSRRTTCAVAEVLSKANVVRLHARCSIAVAVVHRAVDHIKAILLIQPQLVIG